MFRLRRQVVACPPVRQRSSLFAFLITSHGNQLLTVIADVVVDDDPEEPSQP
jgi:hypothetical protein